MDNTAIPCTGLCDARFAGVREAFLANFAERGEVGASVCVMLGGVPVVDLVGGWRDGARTRPWDGATVVNLWSTTKGVMAMCFAMLAERGLMSYDDPVADHWSEFAAHGKQAVTIAMLLSHQAGLCGFAEPTSIADLLAPEAADRLARQAPLWAPGSASGYHAITAGILGTALFRRIEGRSLKAFVRDELLGRHGFDLSIGLEPAENARRAEMLAPGELSSAQIGSLTPPQIAALANPALDPMLANDPAWRAADLASANGHSNAAVLARLYARFAAGGLVSRAVLAEATRPRIDNVDLVLGLPVRWAAGFLTSNDGIYGPNPEAYGHSGWGGSFAFADPARGIAMSYTMNRMGMLLRDDPRAKALIDAAVRAAL